MVLDGDDYKIELIASFPIKFRIQQAGSSIGLTAKRLIHGSEVYDVTVDRGKDDVAILLILIVLDQIMTDNYW